MANTVTFNVRVSLEAAVDNNAGSVNYYAAGYETVVSGNTPDEVAAKLTALGVDEAGVRAATKAMTTAAKTYRK